MFLRRRRALTAATDFLRSGRKLSRRSEGAQEVQHVLLRGRRQPIERLMTAFASEAG